MNEKEIQARVDFKMEELLVGLRNRARAELQLGIDMVDSTRDSMKHAHFAEAFKIFQTMIHKEICMPTPTNHMYQIKEGRAKDKAVDAIMDCLMPHIRGRVDSHATNSIIRGVVSAVESALGSIRGGDTIYTFKDKPYTVVAETKMKISEVWIDVVIYKTQYDNPDGELWVREKGQFYKLFKRVE